MPFLELRTLFESVQAAVVEPLGRRRALAAVPGPTERLRRSSKRSMRMKQSFWCWWAGVEPVEAVDRISLAPRVRAAALIHSKPSYLLRAQGKTLGLLAPGVGVHPGARQQELSRSRMVRLTSSAGRGGPCCGVVLVALVPTVTPC